MINQSKVITQNEQEALDILRNIQDAQGIETTRRIIRAMRSLIAFGLISANDPAIYPSYDQIYRIFYLLDNLEDLLSLSILEKVSKESSNGHALD